MAYFFQRLIFTFSLVFFAKVVLPQIASIPLFFTQVSSEQIAASILGLFWQFVQTGIVFGIFYAMWRIGKVDTTAGTINQDRKSLAFVELPGNFQKDYEDFNRALLSLLSGKESTETKEILKRFVRSDIADQGALLTSIDQLRSILPEDSLRPPQFTLPDLAEVNKDETRVFVPLILSRGEYQQDWKLKEDHWEIDTLAFSRTLAGDNSSNFA